MLPSKAFTAPVDPAAHPLHAQRCPNREGESLLTCHVVGRAGLEPATERL